MARAKDEVTTTVPRASTVVKKDVLDAPAELSADFGVQFCEQSQIQGVVATQFVPELLSAFGIAGVEHFGFPFQRFGKNNDGRTSIRIEPAAGHSLNHVPVVGHQWIFRQESLK